MQAQFFLNAFWDEANDQAEAIYSVAFELIKRADMRWRNITYVRQSTETAHETLGLTHCPAGSPSDADTGICVCSACRHV